MTPTRIAILGSGWAAQKHVAALRDDNDVAIVGIASQNLEHAAILAARAGSRARPWNDYRQMLDAGGIDALITCLPPAERGTPELDAIDRGLHLLVEKPIGLDREIPARIGQRIAETGVLVAVGYQWRYLDLVDRARELLAGRPPQLVLGAWLGSTPRAEWWVRRDGSGGQVLEQATHILDLMRTLVGECEAVAALAVDAAPSGRDVADISDVSTTMLRFDSGAIGSLATARSLSATHRVGLECFSAGQALSLELVPHRLVLGRGTQTSVIAGTDDLAATYRAQDRVFVDAVRGGHVPVRSTWEDAIRTHELALRATELAVTAPATIRS